jgi:UDPglucose 6-dehydrogenase
MKIAVIGTGYVGLVTGTCLAEVGHTVICIDIDRKKVERLQNGVSPIFEPGLEPLITRNIGHDRLFFSTSLAESLPSCEAVFIAVGTPEGADGAADLRVVRSVAQSLGELAAAPLTIIVKSTVPVGTCDEVESIVKAAIAKRGVNVPITIASNPEFLKEGAAIDDFMRPERIVVGLADDAGKAVFEELYRPFVLDDPSRLTFMSRRASELTKYGSNAMLATRISFMNELSRLCERVGANIDDVRRGMGSDSRIGRKFLYSGPGYGGSCFPKDVEALVRTANQYGMRLGVLEAVQAANIAQREHVADKVTRYLGEDLLGKKIAVWGLAFKPGTDDVRDSPARAIVSRLLGAGATVVAHDPEGVENFSREFGSHNLLSYVKNSYDALDRADCLLLITEWSEYKRPNWDKVSKLMAKRVIFDFRNQYEGSTLIAKGFHYECVGRIDSAYIESESR